MKQKYIPALGYHQLTGFYDFVIQWVMPEKRFRTLLIQHLKLDDKEKVMEFGFGTGQNLIMAKELNPSILLTGLDIDAKVKKIAANKIKNRSLEIQLELYEGKEFPYETDYFDKIFSSLAFHQLYTESKKNALQEMMRVLKPGGQLLIADWGEPTSLRYRLGYHFVQLIDGYETTSENLLGLIPVFMKEAGFKEVETIDYINTFWGTFCYYVGKK